jgi:hypothetical protein
MRMNSISIKSKALNVLLGSTIFLNVTILFIDYATRNSHGQGLSHLTDVLTVFNIATLLVSLLLCVYLIVRVRANLRAISLLSYAPLLGVLLLLFCTWPIESWIGSQSYVRGG